MKPFLTIIKSDYLQRTRSYAFLITLCASLAIGYTFVPEPNANYSTITIAGYVGYYNSAWFGYVTAIMTSVFLSLIGFYLINSGIKKDMETRVGQIIATTPISNFKYLFSKVLSNFMLLLTIVITVFSMSILLFVLYNDGYPFEFSQFTKPYVIITIPTMFLISVLAVVFEVLLGKYSVLQNIAFFFLFSALIGYASLNETHYGLDFFGNKIITDNFEETVKNITNSDKEIALNIGFQLGNSNHEKKFEFNGVNFPASFIISRVVWMLSGIAIILITSFFFHRFNRKERVSTKLITATTNKKNQGINEVVLSSLAKAKTNYSVLPLFKAELIMLIRKGKKWLWIINCIGMLLLVILPVKTAHQIILPVLWFLQVSRLSNLTTKETTNNVYYFVFTSFKPLTRLLVSQLLAAQFLMLTLALPLIIRLLIALNFTGAISILLGSIFIVLLAALLGVLTKGKKLFEVLFFLLAYTNINKISFADYFGGFEHNTFYFAWLCLLIVIFATVLFLKRINELKQ